MTVAIWAVVVIYISVSILLVAGVIFRKPPPKGSMYVIIG